MAQRHSARLDVHDQARLPLKRLLEIALDSIAYRLMRSLVTVIIILLAIAFLTVIMGEGYLGRSIRDTVRMRAARKTAYTRFLSAANAMESPEAQVHSFAALQEGKAEFQNVAGWGGFTPDQTRAFVNQSVRTTTYLDFFDNLRLGYRVVLVEQNTGLRTFDWLLDAGNFAVFEKNLEPMKSVRLPGGVKGFQDFLAEWPSYRDRLAQVRIGYGKTLSNIAQLCGEAGVGGKLQAAVKDNKADEFFAQVAAAGLNVNPADKADIVSGVAYVAELEWAFAQLQKEPVRTRWNREFAERFNPGQALISVARSPGRLDWIQRSLMEARLDQGFDAQRLLRVAAQYRGEKELLDQEIILKNRYGMTSTLSMKSLWLILVSLLVCVVGIANAMLMSVLERFKEIATMKCLGARNSTIAFLFVTESVIIGIVGGFAGIIVGFLIIMARLGIQYGGLVFASFPTGDMLATFGICFLCSLLLATMAAIYPAWSASRMAPMDAMRVD